MHLTLLAEYHEPADRRVVLSPQACKEVLQNYPNQLKISIEPYKNRCFSDYEYQKVGVDLCKNLESSDLLMGIKEQPVNRILEGQSYLFFSHTSKGQPHNRKLKQAFIDQKATLYDFEHFKDHFGKRLIAFGFYAGMAGAYHALRAYQIKTGAKKTFPKYQKSETTLLDTVADPYFKSLRIVITGRGRVSQGAAHVLKSAGLQYFSPQEFLRTTHPGYTQLGRFDYYTGGPQDFHLLETSPSNYQSCLDIYTQNADIALTAHYQEVNSPPVFPLQALSSRLCVVCDISCDQNGSVVCAPQLSTLDDPIYGFHKKTHKVGSFFNDDELAVIAIDNLPNLLPKEASKNFGRQFVEKILPLLLKEDRDNIWDRACLIKNGQEKQ